MKLKPEELVEFNLRIATLQMARNQYHMVQESFEKWVRSVSRAYADGKPIEIDPATGEIKVQSSLTAGVDVQRDRIEVESAQAA